MAADRGGEGLGLEEGSFLVHLALILPESGVGAERNQLRKSARSPPESRRFWEIFAILTSQEQRFDMHTVDATDQSSGQKYKGKPKCYNYDRFGHLARECIAAKTMQKANSANQVEMTGNLFYANSTVTGPRVNGEWYIDSGCSNHMTGNVELLVDVRTKIAGKVQMPTGDLVNIAGMGSLVIDTNKGRKYVREVMYQPALKENLLSVGQMDEHGYFLVFGGGMCSIYDGSSLESLVMKVKKKVNRCYPLALLSENQVVLKASVTHSTETWHKRLGHLHFVGLKQLRDKEMVHGLPQLEDYNGIYELPIWKTTQRRISKKSSIKSNCST
ncbi:unnamed protein product [Prunus armeniaca]